VKPQGLLFASSVTRTHGEDRTFSIWRPMNCSVSSVLARGYRGPVVSVDLIEQAGRILAGAAASPAKVLVFGSYGDELTPSLAHGRQA
jgi:hypothetical protein